MALSIWSRRARSSVWKPDGSVKRGDFNRTEHLPLYVPVVRPGQREQWFAVPHLIADRRDEDTTSHVAERPSNASRLNSISIRGRVTDLYGARNPEEKLSKNVGANVGYAPIGGRVDDG